MDEQRRAIAKKKRQEAIRPEYRAKLDAVTARWKAERIATAKAPKAAAVAPPAGDGQTALLALLFGDGALTSEIDEPRTRGI